MFELGVRDRNYAKAHVSFYALSRRYAELAIKNMHVNLVTSVGPVI